MRKGTDLLTVGASVRPLVSVSTDVPASVAAVRKDAKLALAKA